jgi:hypothetical protein
MWSVRVALSWRSGRARIRARPLCHARQPRRATTEAGGPTTYRTDDAPGFTRQQTALLARRTRQSSHLVAPPDGRLVALRTSGKPHLRRARNTKEPHEVSATLASGSVTTRSSRTPAGCRASPAPPRPRSSYVVVGASRAPCRASLRKLRDERKRSPLTHLPRHKDRPIRGERGGKGSKPPSITRTQQGNVTNSSRQTAGQRAATSVIIP